MKKGLLAIFFVFLLGAVSCASFLLGQRYLLHASTEESKAVLRDYRAVKNSAEVLSDLRDPSIIVLDRPSGGQEISNARPNKVVAAVRVVQGKDIYVVLRANGSIEEYTGTLNDL